VARRDPNAAVFNDVRRILHADWDPIGCGVPPDEYDSYAPGAYALIQTDAGVDRIAAYLDETCEQALSLPPDRARSRSAAEKLAALKEQLV